MADRSLSPPRRRINRLFQSVDADLVVWFRIVFAGVAFVWVLKRYTDGLIDPFYIEPRYHFHYDGFDWVQPFSPRWTYVEFVVMGLAALLVGLGACYRIAALVFAFGFTHLFLVDKCLYLNHYYLICLISWLMVVVPANRALSVDAWLAGSAEWSVPRWALWLLRFQVGVPYFFGGIAKVSADWLAGEPMRMMLAKRSDFPFLGSYFTEEWCVHLFAYGGLFFDLLVVPALLTKRFRWLGCLAAIGFHTMNAWLFTIGVFPWFMLLSLPIFFEPGTIRKWFARGSDASQQTTPSQAPFSIILVVLLGMFVTWQTLLPLRHYLIPGNTNWTEEGHYFAWHMLLRGKTSALRLIATDVNSGHSGAIDLRPFVTEYQLSRLSRDPRMIHELVQYCSADLTSKGFDEVEIRVLSLVSMNGRKPQHMIDPTVVLSGEKVGWSKPTWIMPLKEALRSEPWDAPIATWEGVVSPP